MTGNDLRELIQSKLLTVCNNVYYFLADERRLYPHIVFNLARSMKYDSVEKLFNNLNDPQTKLLPTFFVERITNVVDADKSIRHKSVEITVQNYERSTN